MPSERLQAELKRISAFLDRCDDDAKDLWHILTALRGPDNPSAFAEKGATTAVLRYELGIRTDLFGLIINPDDANHADWRRNSGGYSHSKDHAIRAFEALGLDWYTDNQAAKEPLLVDASECLT